VIEIEGCDFLSNTISAHNKSIHIGLEQVLKLLHPESNIPRCPISPHPQERFNWDYGIKSPLGFPANPSKGREPTSDPREALAPTGHVNIVHSFWIKYI